MIWWISLAIIATAMMMRDVQSRIISNRMVLSIWVVGTLYDAWTGWSWSTIGMHVLAALIVGLFTLLAFLRGGFGGGDVKLLTVTTLILPWNALAVFAVLFCVAQIIMALGYFVIKRQTKGYPLALAYWLPFVVSTYFYIAK